MRARTKIMATAVSGVLCGSVPAGVYTFDPTTSGVTAEFDSTPGTQSISRILHLDIENPFQQYPDVYYVKYHSDGQTIAKFDTFGSDFGDQGPLAVNTGAFKGAYNISQLTVYRSDGTKVAITKSTNGRAVLTCKQASPCHFSAASQGRHHASARNNHPSHRLHSPAFCVLWRPCQK